MLRQRIQLGLIHSALAITLVPINGTLNRIMIKELALSATVVAVLVSLAYLFSPMQIAIGSFSDRHPIFGYRRTPFIVLGWLLCIGGLIASPYIAFKLAEDFTTGLLWGIPAFGAWGLGFNFATVSYFSLAAEISGEEGRSTTIAVMFTMMISSIIITSIALGRLLDPYSPEILIRSFQIVAAVAFVIGLLGILGLEERQDGKEKIVAKDKYNWKEMYSVITKNTEATRFLIYLIILLVAIFAQDILLEPYAAEVFGMPPDVTSRFTAIWGTPFLITMGLGAWLEKRVLKIQQARIGAWMGIFSFALIILSALTQSIPMFYISVVFLGASNGLSTVSNLSLMFDMTVIGNIGLLMGAWGMANAISRFIANISSAVIRDVIAYLFNNELLGYISAFGVVIVMFLVSLTILRKIDVRLFQKRTKEELSAIDKITLAGDA